MDRDKKSRNTHSSVGISDNSTSSTEEENSQTGTTADIRKTSGSCEASECSTKSAVSGLDAQLSKNLNVLKAGPMLMVTPAQHLLSSALRLPKGAKRSLIDKNLARLRSHEETEDGGIDDEGDLVNDLDREQDDDSISIGSDINSDYEGQYENAAASRSGNSGDDDEDDKIGDLKGIQGKELSPENTRSRLSLRHRRTSSSASSRSLEARRQTLSPQRFINTISKHSLSPIKSGVAAIGSPIIHKKSSDKVEEPTVEGISRSFAGFLTAASMYAGFQDIEDEDREVESIRNKESTSIDSSTDGELGPPDDATHLEVLDNDDDSDAISGISTPTDTPSLYSGNTIAPAEDRHRVTFDGDGMNSKFEVSVAKNVTDNANPGDQPEVLENKAQAISRKLRETFEISQSEAFIGDYPCWLMGDVLLQGHLYITDNNILFFAFLPKRNKGGISKSGSLSVKSFHSLRMHRKWIILRENTFSVYSSPKDLYFPELVIDLRTALRAEIYGSSKNSNPLVPVWIRIVTEKRTHWFQADNHDVARSWVTILKKHIFASRNKGDQVAIKIPLQNVIDLELTSVVGVTKNLRIKVIENAESFAIDDYFVMFFSKGDAAVEDIKSAIDRAGVVISSSLIDDNDDLKNSDLVKSKIEIIKKSCSSVKLTNFKPKEKKGKLKGFRDSILSSDEDEGTEGDVEVDEQVGTAENDFEGSDAQKHEPMSSKAKSLIPSRLRGRSKSIHIVPDLDTKIGLKKVVDTTHLTNEPVPEKEPHRWTSSIVQGITSFTQSLIFSGPVMHFDENTSFVKEGEDPYFVKDEAKRNSCQKRFVNRFSLNESEKLIATYHLYLLKGLPTYGKLYIGSHEICFRSTIPGTSTVMILPMADIENVNKESGFRFGYFGLVIVIRGHEELFFEFSTHDARDDCEVQILKNLDSYKKLSSDSSATENETEPNLASSAGSLNSARLKMFESKLTDAVGLNVPIIVEEHPLKHTEFKASKPYRFTLLTIGSRGDVQPYIALGKALLKEGHKVKIVTHAEFKGWVESYGIGFDVIAGDPSELMSLMVSHPSINYSFIREAKAKFRDWIDDLLNTSWTACQDCDVLIESPSSIAGIHIAEKLQIPYFRAFTMPWTRTRAYPNAFMVPDQKLGGAYNYMTHVAFENGYWRGTCYQVNKWRVQTLGLPKTSLGAMHQNSVPFLYNMSPVVFPPSVDFPEWVKVTGYWFLDESASYVPPKELTDFIKRARDDDKKLVYIGFGSIVVDNPKELTQAVVDAVLESDVRCILNKGWSDRLGSKNKNEVEIDLPEEVFNSGNVPHDWLFTQIDAAVHHGGSGSTGASLRFGLPTIIKPFFGDQKFYANRVEDLGCGVALKSLESKHMAKALKEVTTNKRIIEKAKVVGEKIRSEHGVQNAINAIYVLMDYATKLSISKHKQDLADDEQEGYDDSNEGNDIDGSWLLV